MKKVQTHQVIKIRVIMTRRSKIVSEGLCDQAMTNQDSSAAIRSKDIDNNITARGVTRKGILKILPSRAGRRVQEPKVLKDDANSSSNSYMSLGIVMFPGNSWWIHHLGIGAVR